MDFKKVFDTVWHYLMRTDEHLHMPLMYVIAPLSIIALILLCCCCFFCIKACNDEPDIHIVPSYVPAVRPRHPDGQHRHDRIQPSGSVRDLSGSRVELNEDVTQNINAMYKKRNYQVPE